MAAGLSGLEAHVLQAARSGIAPEDLQRARGWTVEEWMAAEGALARRGLDGDAGGALLDDVEARTDELAWSAGLAVLGEAGVDAVRETLASSVAAVLGTEWIRFPNPMGLPRPETG